MLPATTTTSQRCPVSQYGAGFTLIELMVVMLIIAILSVIAISTYESFITRSKVRTAENDLVALSLNVENYMQRQLQYPVLSTKTTADTAGDFKGWHPAQGADFTYTIQSTAAAYKVVAAGISGPLATCVLTLDSDDVRTVAGQCGSITSW